MAISVKLQAFEGPLDLLLHLIEKNKVDIYDIPIVEITNQYLEYIRAMEAEDMNVMSEFLVMAATLVDIKCKMLLPKELECNTALISYMVYEKAEGGWIIDGEESMFGYCGMVNTFRFEPQTEVALVFDGKGFLAIVKRDPRTESFFK